MSGSERCPFCERLAHGEEFAGEGLAAALWDSFPVNPGHALVVPRRHVADYFALSNEEKQAVWRLMDVVRDRLQREFEPHGFNVGVNVGAAAGQTVFHAHVHVIPRFPGDVGEARGGVRWVIPKRAPYWKTAGR